LGQRIFGATVLVVILAAIVPIIEAFKGGSTPGTPYQRTLAQDKFWGYVAGHKRGKVLFNSGDHPAAVGLSEEWLADNAINHMVSNPEKYDEDYSLPQEEHFEEWKIEFSRGFSDGLAGYRSNPPDR
jgi:hypothetical protein